MQRLIDLPARHEWGFRLLWKVGGSLIVVGALLFGTTQVVTALAHEEETIVTIFDEPDVDTLDIESDSGSVRVVGTDRSSISVTAEVSDGLIATEHSARVEDDRLVLRASCSPLFTAFCEVDYTVEVPREVAVVVQVGNGSATVHDIEATVQVSTDNGGVELEGVAGDVDADSDNGSVVATGLLAERVSARSDNGAVRLSWAAVPRSVDARSDNGRVELVLPDIRVSYRVDFTADNGSVDTQIDTSTTSERTLTAHSDNGSVTARYAH